MGEPLSYKELNVLVNNMTLDAQNVLVIQYLLKPVLKNTYSATCEQHVQPVNLPLMHRFDDAHELAMIFALVQGIQNNICGRKNR